MDFGFSNSSNKGSNSATTTNTTQQEDPITSLETGGIDHDNNGETVDNLNTTTTDNNGEDTTTKPSTPKGNKDGEQTSTNTGEETTPLEVGTQVEFEGKTYTIDDKGNLIDDNKTIFKEASEVNDWIKGLDVEDDNGDDSVVNIKSIKDAIGIDITDDKGKPVEFDDSIDGIKSYVNAVIENQREENYQTAINTLYQRYPIVEDVLNYYVANGNSLDGFGEVPDYSAITIDDKNEAQQESIIRAAWQNNNRKGDVEGYINYLKSSGTLLATAQEELTGMQEAAEQYKQELAKQAQQKEDEEVAKLEKYWNSVHDTIKSRKFGEYQIPESIVVNRNGQKFTATPDDFFNYLYRVDEHGHSQYENELAQEAPENRMKDELIRAYLKFVGGNYSNLVDMAINDKEIKKLRIRAKERTAPSVRITKPNNAGGNSSKIDLGY